MQGKGGSGWEAATFQGKQGPLKIRHVDSQFFYIFPRAASTTTRSSVHLLPPPFTRKEFFIDLQTFVRLPHMRKFYIYFCFILLQKTMWRRKLANNHLLYFNGFLTKRWCDQYGPNHWPCLNTV